MEVIIAQIIWITSACLDGYLQAHYYSLFPSEKKHKNLHGWYIIQRAILLGIIVYELWFIKTGWECFIFAFASCLMYSFFHNGFYYMTRHKLDHEVYKKGFWDNSDTSESFFNFSVKFRISMSIIGIVFIIGLILESNA